LDKQMMFFNYRMTGGAFILLLISFIFFNEIRVNASEGNANDACSDFNLMRRKCKSQMKPSAQKSCFSDLLTQSNSQKEELISLRKPISCPVSGEKGNLCAGLTCIVDNVHECRQVMRNNGCGVAVYTQDNNQINQFHCTMLSARNSSLSHESPIYLKESVTNILYFKKYSGVGASPTVADAFLTSPFSQEILFPRTTATYFSTGNYYKSPLWNIRDKLGASTVTVAMHGNMQNDFSDSCELTFANTKAANGEWFNKDNLISSFPVNVNQLKSLVYNIFSIVGVLDNLAFRQFLTIQYNGCPGDIGAMSVVNKDDICPWGNSPQPLPRFRCAAAWYPDSPITPNEPNINSRGRFMKEIEITGKLLRPINILYVGLEDIGKVPII
jgi:hypothetical protein